MIQHAGAFRFRLGSTSDPHSRLLQNIRLDQTVDVDSVFHGTEQGHRGSFAMQQRFVVEGVRYRVRLVSPTLDDAVITQPQHDLFDSFASGFHGATDGFRQCEVGCCAVSTRGHSVIVAGGDGEDLLSATIHIAQHFGSVGGHLAQRHAIELEFQQTASNIIRHLIDLTDAIQHVLHHLGFIWHRPSCNRRHDRGWENVRALPNR
mmetsp:Transcript_16256/g.45062  ORF Transcript_16256/g.45062 Transcript_16256/m.45062 type:complete len:205 (-) Transcript_16256:210-824(-)